LTLLGSAPANERKRLFFTLSMYESLFKHLLFPFYETTVKKRGTVRHLRDLESSQWLSADDLSALQLRKLNALLEHAWRDVPFLKQFWGDHAAPMGPLKHVSELTRYPVLTKDVVKANYDGMVSTSWRGRTLSKTTGGSTGTPFRLEYTMDSYAARTALMWRGYRWADAELGRRTLYVWGVPLGASAKTMQREDLFHRLYNRRMVNSFDLRTDNAAEYIKAINEFQPKTLVGYVAPLVVLAEWIIRTGTKVHRPSAVITGAEALNEAQRDVIESAFGAPAFNTYGSREVGLIGAECAEKTGLHVSIDHMVVETVDDEGHSVSGCPGHVLITDLSNYGMPFVRYQIGDAATFSNLACPCGRQLPLFSAVHGRTLDLIRTRDGRILPGEFFPHLLKDFAFIQQYQVVQHNLDHLEVKVVLEPGQPLDASPHSEAHLMKLMRQALGEQMRISLSFVDAIPLTLAGKRRTTISHVSALPHEVAALSEA
jgi:phenylacetate-CoA ligase